MNVVTAERTKSHRLVTMRELNQRTSEVMKEILDDEDPVLVTKYGRPVAVILPMPAKAESLLLEGLVRETIADYDDQDVASLDDAARRAGLDPEHVRLRAEVAET